MEQFQLLKYKFTDYNLPVSKMLSAAGIIRDISD